MLKRGTILTLVIALTPFLMGSGCSFAYFATIHNNSDQDVQLSFFADYTRTQMDQITLAPNDSFSMSLALDFQQTITVQAEGFEPVERQFSNPGGLLNSSGILDIYICTAQGEIQLTEIANRQPAPTGKFWTVSGDQFALPDVGFPWYAHPDNDVAVELVPREGTVVAIEAPQIEEATWFVFNSDGCADSAAYEVSVEVLPAPAYIIVDPALAEFVDGQRHERIAAGRVSLGRQFELTADMRGRDPDLYTIAWSAEPERMAAFDDLSAVTTTVTLPDVGWVMVTLTVTDNQTGLHAEDTLTFLEVVYDGPRLEVDAGQDRANLLGNPVLLAATPYGSDMGGSCGPSGGTDTTHYVWRQDETNPALWSEVTARICGFDYAGVPSPAPDSIEGRFLRFRPTEVGTYRFDLTATDPTGAFQDTDYVIITVTEE